MCSEKQLVVPGSLWVQNTISVIIYSYLVFFSELYPLGEELEYGKEKTNVMPINTCCIASQLLYVLNITALNPSES